MPIRLSDLAAQRREIEVPFDEETVTVTYLPGKMTMQMQQRANQAMTMPADSGNRELAEILCELVVGWDVLGDDGLALAVTPETMSLLPLRFVTVLTKALFADINPNAKSASS